MGDVAAKVEVIPDGLEVDLEVLKSSCTAAVSKYGELAKTEEKPMAFGMKMLVFIVVLKDQSGGVEPMEEDLRKIEGVSRAETVDVRRLM